MERIVERRLLGLIPFSVSYLFNEEESDAIREEVRSVCTENGHVNLGRMGDKIIFRSRPGALTIIRHKRSHKRQIGDAVAAIRFYPTIGLRVEVESAE